MFGFSLCIVLLFKELRLFQGLLSSLAPVSGVNQTHKQTNQQAHLSLWRSLRRTLPLPDSADCFSLLCSQSRKLSCCFWRLERKPGRIKEQSAAVSPPRLHRSRRQRSLVQVVEQRLHSLLPAEAVAFERVHFVLLLSEPLAEVGPLLRRNLLASSLQLLLQLLQASLGIPGLQEGLTDEAQTPSRHRHRRTSPSSTCLSSDSRRVFAGVFPHLFGFRGSRSTR